MYRSKPLVCLAKLRQVSLAQTDKHELKLKFSHLNWNWNRRALKLFIPVLLSVRLAVCVKPGTSLSLFVGWFVRSLALSMRAQLQIWPDMRTLERGSLLLSALVLLLYPAELSQACSKRSNLKRVSGEPASQSVSERDERLARCDRPADWILPDHLHPRELT